MHTCVSLPVPYLSRDLSKRCVKGAQVVTLNSRNEEFFPTAPGEMLEMFRTFVEKFYNRYNCYLRNLVGWLKK
jgi:hypothetical protein